MAELTYPPIEMVEGEAETEVEKEFKKDLDFLDTVLTETMRSPKQLQVAARVFYQAFHHRLSTMRMDSAGASKGEPEWSDMFVLRSILASLYLAPLLIPNSLGEDIPPENLVLARRLIRKVVDYYLETGNVDISDPHIMWSIVKSVANLN